MEDVKDIKVTIGETEKPSKDWRVISGPVDSPLNGFLEFSFFNKTPGDHTFKIETKGFETVTLSYTILQEKTNNPCRPYSYSMLRSVKYEILGVNRTCQPTLSCTTYIWLNLKYINLSNFTLPGAADEKGIEAKYVDGVLCVDIAKREEAKMQSRQIEIK